MGKDNKDAYLLGSRVCRILLIVFAFIGVIAFASHLSLSASHLSLIKFPFRESDVADESVKDFRQITRDSSPFEDCNKISKNSFQIISITTEVISNRTSYSHNFVKYASQGQNDIELAASFRCEKFEYPAPFCPKSTELFDSLEQTSAMPPIFMINGNYMVYYYKCMTTAFCRAL